MQVEISRCLFLLLYLTDKMFKEVRKTVRDMNATMNAILSNRRVF